MSNKEFISLTPLAAWQLIQQDRRAVLVDIRSTMEFLFVGHPKGAIHIPWIDEPEWTVNPNFAAEVRKLLLGGAICDDLQGCTPVILICRSGKRSVEAAKTLLASGFNRIYHVNEGFEGDLDEHYHRSSKGGWRFQNLPWEQC